MMTNEARAMAALSGINRERYNLLYKLGLEFEQYDCVKSFDTTQLRLIHKLKLPKRELLKLVQREHFSLQNGRAYTELRKLNESESELAKLSFVEMGYLLRGLNMGLPRGLVRRAGSEGVSIEDVATSIEAGVDFDAVLELHRIHRHSTRDYIAARQAGFSHEELVMVAGVKDYGNFTIGMYCEIRGVGISREQVVALLEDTSIGRYQRESYIEYVTRKTGALSHDDTYKLLIAGVNPDQYWRAREVSSHGQVMEVVMLSERHGNFDKYHTILSENCRISHEEALQYLQFTGYVTGINEYIKLIDAGYPFDQIKKAHDADVSLSYFGYLRSAPLSLTQEQLLEIPACGIECNQYERLREQDLSHAVIIKSAQSLLRAA